MTTPTVRFYTSQQLARILGVSVPTVVNWARAGKLEHHKTPGGHRRFSQAAVQRFSERHGYPLPSELRPERNESEGIVIVDPEPDFAELIREMLTIRGCTHSVWLATNAFECGLLIGHHRPAVLVIDVGMADLDGTAVTLSLQAHAAAHPVKVIGLATVNDARLAGRATAAGFTALRSKADDLEELVDLIQSLL